MAQLNIYADLTHLGECQPYKLEVIGSSPIIGTTEMMGNRNTQEETY